MGRKEIGVVLSMSILYLDKMPDQAAKKYPTHMLDSAIQSVLSSFDEGDCLYDWVHESRGNYAWMAIHAQSLLDTWYNVNGSHHPLKDSIETIYYSIIPASIPSGMFSAVPLDLPYEYRAVEFSNGEVHALEYVPIDDAVELSTLYINDMKEVKEMRQ
tara:strand:- start:19 stop:492 length:474 start_codon:yes stop_codon:yes gene_type:complete